MTEGCTVVAEVPLRMMPRNFHGPVGMLDVA